MTHTYKFDCGHSEEISDAVAQAVADMPDLLVGSMCCACEAAHEAEQIAAYERELEDTCACGQPATMFGTAGPKCAVCYDAMIEQASRETARLNSLNTTPWWQSQLTLEEQLELADRLYSR